MRDLDILIPARNEEWLSRTVADVLAHTSECSSVIAVLDGAPATPPLVSHDRLMVITTTEPIGQRGATNLAAQHSTARYIMKLDAHCAVADGFDRHMLAAADILGPLATLVPKQSNLHVFDWRCVSCGATHYQGPTPTACPCGYPKHERIIRWKPRGGTSSVRWRFDRDLHFQYWSKPGPLTGGDTYPETMSCLGACWMLRRDRYWDVFGGLDEAHGSWGQMGTEIACKSWLSGGELRTVTPTWYAHLFRTRPGFSFPYALADGQVQHARQHSQAMWRGNQWPNQVRDLAWLVEKFQPLGWEQADIDAVRWERAA